MLVKTAGVPLGFTVRYNPQALVAARQQTFSNGSLGCSLGFRVWDNSGLGLMKLRVQGLEFKNSVEIWNRVL